MYTKKRRQKKIRVVVIGLFAIILLGVWIYLVADVNRRLPDAVISKYSSETPAIIEGIEFKPIEAEIMTNDEFKEKYYSSKYDELEKNNPDIKLKICVYKMKVHNTNNDTFICSPQYASAYNEKSGWFNGCTFVTNNGSLALKPDEESLVLLSAAVTSNAIKPAHFKSLKAADMSLILSFYPERKVLCFD